MAPFDFISNITFVASADKTTIQVYELTTSTASPSAVRTTDWKTIGTIGGTHQDHQYDSLKLFDEEIRGRDLRNLAEDLAQSHFFVNPHGNCFLDVSAGEFVDPAFGVQYLRLNDTFNWSQYGVVKAPPLHPLWSSRHALPYRGGEAPEEEELNEAIVDYGKQLKGKEAKLGELSSRLASKKAELESAKKDVEKYRKWCSDFKYRYKDTISTLEAPVKIKRRRVRVPKSTFRVSSPPIVPNSPVGCRVPSFKEETIDAFWLLDEDCGGFPLPPAVQVWSSDGKFDGENWWCIKANRRVQGGETTMLVYYEGEFDYAEFDNPMTSRRERVPVPYKVKNGEFAADRNFSLGYFSFTWEVRVVFTYRW
ncbi:hypothetical protein LINGRAHAP2_LOCUS6759 [Linum grandiflorum]